MSTSSTFQGRSSANGTQTAPMSAAAKIASGGIHTAADFPSISCALIEDVFTGAVDNKQGHLACRAIRGGITSVEFALKVGYGTVVNPARQAENDPIEERQQELLAELAQLEEAKKLRA